MKQIPYTEGYFADESGNIFSFRPIKRSKTPRTTPYKLKPQRQQNGYYSVMIIFKDKLQTMHIHFLILLTFVGERPSEKHQGCHGIGGKSDNSIGNLSWKTASQNNYEDKKRDRTLRFGNTHPMSKLTTGDIIKIRTYNKYGMNNHEIADIFNVSHSNISKILKGHTWNHV